MEEGEYLMQATKRGEGEGEACERVAVSMKEKMAMVKEALILIVPVRHHSPGHLQSSSPGSAMAENRRRVTAFYQQHPKQIEEVNMCPWSSI